MKKYYYIEVMKTEGEDEQLMARFATTYGNMRYDASCYSAQHPAHDIRMVIASEKERVFNNLNLKSA